MHPSVSLRHAATRVAALVSMVLAAAAATPGAPRSPARLPGIVFVSRQPVPGGTSAIPGMGPHHRAVVTGGRLLVREPDGRLREPIPPGIFHDVSDPTVSRDARRIAFAAVTHPDSAWRIWVVGLDGSGLRQITFTDRTTDLGRLGAGGRRFERYDDLDPCWIEDSMLVFASTRYPQRAQYADVPVTNLFVATAMSPERIRWFRERESRTVSPHRRFGVPQRITSERNGAEEPAMDWTRGQIVFARWWFNRLRAAATPTGVSDEGRALLPADSVNLWQPMELGWVLHRARLAAGDLRTRRGSMGYQPAVLADGSIASVYAANLGLSPQPGGTGVHRFSGRFGHARRLAGAIVAGRGDDVYSGAGGLAPPSACSPAGLPDGRVLFSYSPGARGDFGIYVVDRHGSGILRVIDLPGTLELDAAPILERPRPPGEAAPSDDELAESMLNTAYVAFPESDRRRPDLPPLSLDSLGAERGTFRFHNLDVFRDGSLGSPARGAARATPGARIRFFATLARPERKGGDTALLVREAPVGPNGEVNESGLPADVPMFEQLVDSSGRVLMTAHGPAHVAGSNAGLAGYASRCVGCHLGHSTLPVARATPGARHSRP